MTYCYSTLAGVDIVACFPLGLAFANYYNNTTKLAVEALYRLNGTNRIATRNRLCQFKTQLKSVLDLDLTDRPLSKVRIANLIGFL
jgi:hypothetical protein